MFDFPSIYHFSKKESEYHLYLGEYSTVDALSKFDDASSVQITGFEATHFDENGYTSLEKLPALKSVESVIAYLNGMEETFTLINFTALIGEFGTISTHDDGECHLTTDTEKSCFDLVRKVAPLDCADALINALKAKPDIYLRSDKTGGIQTFESFEDYIEASD